MGVTGWWIAPDLGKTRGVARTIWKGSLSFGLVNVPVGLYPATKDKTIGLETMCVGGGQGAAE